MGETMGHFKDIDKDIDPGGEGPGLALSDTMIAKVGTAVGRIATIQQRYKPRVAAADTDDERHDLQRAAAIEAVRVIRDEGLTIEQYDEIVEAARHDPVLEERLIDAAGAI